MFAFLGSLLYSTLVTPAYLEWAQRQTDTQIDKMQAAVFNTPGAEAPLPPAVIATGVGLLWGHWMLGRMLGLRSGPVLLSLLLGGGAAFYLRFRPGPSSQS
jgi:hypothetical protein